MEKQYKDVTESFWNPEKENDFVEGVLKLIKNEVGQNKSRMYVIKTKNGIVNIWGSKVLDEKMALVNLDDEIKIIYLGEKSGKRKYHDYKVQIAVSQEVEGGDE